MSLIDTTGNMLMLGAYGWAFVKPVRKLYYNLSVTAISVGVAFAVGGIEVLGLLAGRMHLNGVVWALVAQLNNNFELVGYGIVALLAAAWVASMVVYKTKGFDRLEFSSSGVDQTGNQMWNPGRLLPIWTCFGQSSSTPRKRRWKFSGDGIGSVSLPGGELFFPLSCRLVMVRRTQLSSS